MDIKFLFLTLQVVKMFQSNLNFILKIVLIGIMLFAGNTAFAQDFGINVNAGVEKKIIKGLKVGIEGTVRSQNNSSALERLAIGADIGYKPIKYLKLDASYSFLGKYYEESTTKKGNILSSYWSPRHRFEASIAGILPIGDFEISIRERYQLTHRSEVSVAKWDEDGETRKSDEIVTARNEHMWRSRIHFSYDFHVDEMVLTPYGNFELFNDLTNSFKVDKLRFIIGLEYEIVKHSAVEIYYRYTAPIADEDDEDIHLLGFGYTFSF